MKLETKRRLSMLLLAVAVIFWLLRQLAVVYIPGVSALALAGAMLLLACLLYTSPSPRDCS